MSTSGSPALSISNNIWLIKSQYPEDIFDEILRSRNISPTELAGKYEELDNLAKLKNIKPAAKKILEFKDQKIGIFADYDVDGLCGGAIMHRSCSMLGIECITYIPKREEGYGLNRCALDFFNDQGVRLVVTIDCGIKNESEVEYAKSLGMEVIVTDHHKIIGNTPDCLIVHADITENGQSSMLSGGGVAFMIAKELINSDKSKWLLDLAALSTISDMVPLSGANRILAKFGLIVLNQTRNIGLRELIKTAKVDLGFLSAYHVAFILGPKLNASGRLEDPMISFKLLTTASQPEAVKDAQMLNELNQKRQDTVNEHLEKLISKYKDKKIGKQFIIEFDPVFKDGVLGLVAGKLTEKFYRPSIVLTNHDGILKGSARSIKGIDITNLLAEQKDDLVAFGGHAMAAGLSIAKEKLESFMSNMNKLVKNLDDEIFTKKLEIDAMVNLSQLSLDLADKLEILEPFGIGNPKPVFAVAAATIVSQRECGLGGIHQQIKIGGADAEIDGIIFNTPENGKFKQGQRYDIAFSLEKDTFRGTSKAKLMIKDFRKI